MPSYIKIPTEILQEKKLNHAQILLYGIIMSLVKKEGYCRASNKTLGDMLGVGIWMVQNSIKRLKEEGYISVELEENNKRKITINGYVENHTGVCEISQGGMGNITPNNNIEYISSKEDIIPPQKNEENSTTSGTKKRTTNEHLLVGEKKEQFEKFWKTYPHYQGRSNRKNSIAHFIKLDIQQVMLGATLLKREMQAKPEQQGFVKASERWLKNFTPISEAQKQTRLMEIFTRHMKKGGDDMKERMEELKEDFPDIDFKPMLYEYQKSKSLLNNMKFT